MVIYAIILFLTAGLFALLGAAVYRGRIDLIHDYHQKKVTDAAGYGRAFGKALLVIAAGMLLSGVIGLLGDSDGLAAAAVAVLTISLVGGIAGIVAVQKKYNGGVF